MALTRIRISKETRRVTSQVEQSAFAPTPGQEKKLRPWPPLRKEKERN